MELAKALAKAQAEMKGAKRDAVNPFHKNHYADLESIWDACRLPLNDNGLSIIQTIGSFINTSGNTIDPTLTTMLLHGSGEWISDTAILAPKTPSPQDVASCVTYARRYGLAAMVGVVQTDDDGEQAMGRGSQQTQRPVQAAPARGSAQDPRYVK